MSFFVIIQPILIIGILILIGFFISRNYTFNGDTRKLFITLIINAGMPAIILSSIFKVEINESMFRKIILVLIISIIINVIGITIGLICAYFLHSHNRVESAILSGLGNTGFIGIPLCAVLFGPEGALFAAIFDAGVDITIWTVGVTLLNSKERFSFKSLKGMINIPFAAIIVGLSLAYIGYKPPFAIGETIDYLAAFVIPLAMFYIGGLLGTMKRSEIQRTQQIIWLPLVIKLLIVPFIAVFIVTLFSITGVLAQIILIQSMMPSITLASILFSRYRRDEGYGAIVTITSTVLSLPLIPIMYYLMMSLFAIT